MSTSVRSRPFARSGFLIAMIAGAIMGTVVARALEAAIGGSDPEFVGVLGAAFGGIMGRSLWMRVRSARDAGRAMVLPVLLLLARVALCGVVAFALFGAPTLSAGARVAMALLGGLSYAGLGLVEVRWFRAAGAPHVD